MLYSPCRCESARPVIAAGAGGPAFAEDPICAVHVRAVEKARRAKEMHADAVLVRSLLVVVAGVRWNILTVAFEVETLRVHIDILTVPGEYVGQCDGHVEPLDVYLKVFPRIGVCVVEDLLGYFVACYRIEPEESQTAVEEHGPARDAIDRIVLHEYAAVNGPDRLNLLVCGARMRSFAGPGAPPGNARSVRRRRHLGNRHIRRRNRR